MMNVDVNVGKPQFGTARLPNGEVVNVQFVLSGKETSIQIADPRKGIGEPSLPVIHVDLVDGTKLSFLQNIRTSVVQHHGGGGSLLTYFPHFVFIGNTHITPDVAVDEFTFTTGDAQTIFYDFDAFSIDICADRARISQIVTDREKKIGRATEVGDHPIIAYFTGKFEIVSAESTGIVIRALHQPRYGMGGPGGIAIENSIKISLGFDSPTPLREGIGQLITLLRFFQIVAGRKQSVSKLRVRIDGAKEHEWHELHWCLAWSDKGSDQDNPGPADIPLNGGTDPSGFATVISRWFETDKSAIDARVRFSRSFEQGRAFGPDRLVGAANLFDLLPSTYFEKSYELNSEERAARDEAIRLFTSLPSSDVRDRALGDLGRLGNHNLKSRVLHRAKPVIRDAAGRLEGLEIVLRDAIDARNHFVHGTSASAKKAKLFRENTAFYIRALEVLFAIAELLDCGWNFNTWCRAPKSQSHPFSEFLSNFAFEYADYRTQR